MTCCGFKPIWVENVPGKGYHYCTECKKEVVEGPLEFDLIEISKAIDEAMKKQYNNAKNTHNNHISGLKAWLPPVIPSNPMFGVNRSVALDDKVWAELREAEVKPPFKHEYSKILNLEALVIRMPGVVACFDHEAIQLLRKILNRS